MRTMLHWLDAAVVAQPFYPDEIMVIRMALSALRFRVSQMDIPHKA